SNLYVFMKLANCILLPAVLSLYHSTGSTLYPPAGSLPLCALAGFEPATSGIAARRSVQLSYKRIIYSVFLSHRVDFTFAGRSPFGPCPMPAYIKKGLPDQ